MTVIVRAVVLMLAGGWLDSLPAAIADFDGGISLLSVVYIDDLAFTLGGPRTVLTAATRWVMKQVGRR